MSAHAPVTSACRSRACAAGRSKTLVMVVSHWQIAREREDLQKENSFKQKYNVFVLSHVAVKKTRRKSKRFLLKHVQNFLVFYMHTLIHRTYTNMQQRVRSNESDKIQTNAEMRCLFAVFVQYFQRMSMAEQESLIKEAVNEAVKEYPYCMIKQTMVPKIIITLSKFGNKIAVGTRDHFYKLC